VIDQLTGLPRREALLEAVAARCAGGRPFALAIIDIDNFINLDFKLSRVAGDGILRRVAAFYAAEGGARAAGAPGSACAAPAAAAYRYGGDEFALLYDGLDAAAARDVVDDVRKRFRRSFFVYDAQDNLIQIPITMSAGVTAFPAYGAAPLAILRCGESALAMAKKYGRNRVMMPPDPDAVAGPSPDSGATALAVPGAAAKGPIIETVLGQGLKGYSGDGGPAHQAEISEPYGVYQDTLTDAWFFADRGNHCLRMVAPDGTVSTVAGTGEYGPSGDGGPARAARLHKPSGVAVDTRGDLYIADTGNHRIRRIDRATWRIFTLAGCGQPGYTGDGGPAASATMVRPGGVVVDARGAVYFNDYGNNVIRGVTPDGTMFTLAGTGQYGYGGDGGPATAAAFNKVYGLGVDPAGDVYVADYANHCIRRVDVKSGTISTVAGVMAPGYDGDGGPAAAAHLNAPFWVAFDGRGNMYICDAENHCLRRVDAATGRIATVAGRGRPGYSGDGGPAVQARLNVPAGVVACRNGALLIADYGNNCVRRVAPAQDG